MFALRRASLRKRTSFSSSSTINNVPFIRRKSLEPVTGYPNILPGSNSGLRQLEWSQSRFKWSQTSEKQEVRLWGVTPYDFGFEEFNPKTTPFARLGFQADAASHA